VECRHISKRWKQRICQKQLPLFLKTRGYALAFESRIYLMPLMNRISTDCTVFHVLAYADFKAVCLVKRHNTTRFFAEAQRFYTMAKLRKSIISFVISVCLCVCPSARNNMAPTARIDMTFNTRVIYRVNSSSLQLTKITENLHED
jgi:hypothetical protein